MPPHEGEVAGEGGVGGQGCSRQVNIMRVRKGGRAGGRCGRLGYRQEPGARGRGGILLRREDHTEEASLAVPRALAARVRESDSRMERGGRRLDPTVQPRGANIQTPENAEERH